MVLNLNIYMMNDFIVRFGKQIFLPTCILMISYCVCYQYIANLPYIYVVKIILFLSFVFQAVIRIMDTFNGKTRNNSYMLSHNPLVKKMYLNSRQIITQGFCYYFAVYLIFFLDKKSIFYNYLVLFLFGLFLGYEIAFRSVHYKK